MKSWWNAFVDRGMNRINGRWASLFTLVFLVFIFGVLPAISQWGEQVGLTQSIDTSFGFSADRLWAIVEGYSASVRQAYLIQRWTFDLVFPLVYGGFFGGSGLYLLKRLNAKTPLTKILVVIPFGVLFDYLENSLVSLVFLFYPQRILGLTELAVLMIPVKWFFVTSSMIVVFGLALWSIIRPWFKK
jgi:hypothetical protein